MTADPSGTEVSSSIEQIAAEWAVRVASDEMTADDRAELDAWLNADARHQGAFVRAQAAWLGLDRLAAMSAPRSDIPSARAGSTALTGGASESAHARPEGNSHPPSAIRSTARTSSRRFFLAAGLGAVAVTAASGGFWLWHRRGEVYESDIGEIRQVTLSDGSTMHLDSATKAEVRFSESRREIELLQGQGFFEVTKDPARPFIVLARGVSVRAVGTAFTVRAVDQDVAVTVTEGVVEVADETPGDSARVIADQRAIVSALAGIKVEGLPSAQVERHLAWRDGMLSFDGESLADAVRELNRHSTRHIRIDNSELAGRPVVGIFRAADTEGFARTVAAALGADCTDEADAIHLRLRARP